MSEKYSPEEIKRANVEYHTKMATSYDDDQPHFMPENIEKVEIIIRNLAERFGNHTLLDIGCGTGFVLNIAKKYFNNVVGIDLTQAMLDRVDLSGGNVEVKLADTSNLPFNNESFNVITAYGFLHHLPELESTFQETFRCLKFGGVFYADLDPNYYCWKEINKLGNEQYSEVLQREINSMKNAHIGLQSKYNLDENIVKLAEFQKLIGGGMHEDHITKLLSGAGFVDVNFKYEWFLGQGYVIHSISEEAARIFENHLRQLLPLSRSLFKYFSIMAQKYKVQPHEQ